MGLKQHLNKIEYFCMVVDAGSFKKASKMALVGQPQLTKVVSQLEDLLDTDLLVRSAKGVIPTQTGQRLYKYSKQILDTADEAEFAIKSPDAPPSGSVRIGTYDSIACYFFPDVLRYLQVTAPTIDVFLETGRSAHIVDRLEAKKLDIAVVIDQGTKSAEISSSRMYQDSFGLFRSPTMDVVFESRLIGLDQGGEQLKRLAGKYGFRETLSCDNLETVKSLTEQGVGVGILPHRVARDRALAKQLTSHGGFDEREGPFGPHDIILCHIRDQGCSAKELILREVDRFLQIWSRG